MDELAIDHVVIGALEANCWIVRAAGSRETVLIDPGDEPERILAAVEGLVPVAIVLTHAHWDHVLGLPMVARALGAPVLAHPDEAPVWPHEQEHLARHGYWSAGTATDELLAAGHSLRPEPGRELWDGVPDRLVREGDEIAFGGQALRVLHTPGHTPGGLSLYTPGHVFTGDTLFPGGPGLTGYPLSDFGTIIEAIRSRLFVLPDATQVHPGHGHDTTIGAERPQLDEWIRRGW